MALSHALRGAREYGADTRLILLRDYELVFYGAVDEADYPPDVVRLREEFSVSDGIIFGSPEYHGSMGRQVVKFASWQRSVRNTDFMKMWEGLPT